MQRRGTPAPPPLDALFLFVLLIVSSDMVAHLLLVLQHLKHLAGNVNTDAALDDVLTTIDKDLHVILDVLILVELDGDGSGILVRTTTTHQLLILGPQICQRLLSFSSLCIGICQLSIRLLVLGLLSLQLGLQLCNQIILGICRRSRWNFC